MKVKRRRFEVTTVRGPLGEVRECFVYRLMRDLISVVLPTYPVISFCSTIAIDITNSWRANHCDNDWGCLLRQAIHQGDMESLFLDLFWSEKIVPKVSEVFRHTSWDRAACFCSRPGFA